MQAIFDWPGRVEAGLPSATPLSEEPVENSLKLDGKHL